MRIVEVTHAGHASYNGKLIAASCMLLPSWPLREMAFITNGNKM
jgi:hypothetical protein